VISLNLVLAGLRLGLKNRQVGEKWVSDDCSYLSPWVLSFEWSSRIFSGIFSNMPWVFNDTNDSINLAGLRLGLKNRQVGEKWVSDDCSYLCKALYW
jgi:hypothetical protein